MGERVEVGEKEIEREREREREDAVGSEWTWERK